MTINITVQFGSGRRATRRYEVPVTIQTAINDTARELGFDAEAVDASLAGVPQPLTTTLREGDTVVVTTKPCGKAA